uniref:Uncharacterized protein n=1 Tax=Neogobius melanostomus TaxID=47308 RepID=A0A8C6U7L3_9GOBI
SSSCILSILIYSARAILVDKENIILGQLFSCALCLSRVVQCSDKGMDSAPYGIPYNSRYILLMNNRIKRSMIEAAWTNSPGLLILSMSNNSLGNCSNSLPNAVLLPLCKLQTLNLDYNQPLSIKEMYLKGNRIEEFHSGTFNGISELLVLDLSRNRLTNRGLLKDSLLNVTHHESLNLEGNRLKKFPQHLPPSLKTLNLEGNLIATIKKSSFRALINLEHLGLARNWIFKVVGGAFKALLVLHQLDLGHNAMRQVPRQLPKSLYSVALSLNRIHTVPRDTFCWGNTSTSALKNVRKHYDRSDSI